MPGQSKTNVFFAHMQIMCFNKQTLLIDAHRCRPPNLIELELFSKEECGDFSLFLSKVGRDRHKMLWMLNTNAQDTLDIYLRRKKKSF